MALTGEPTGQECHHQWIIQPAEGPVSEGICHNCHEVRSFANNLERHDRLNDGSQSPSAPTVGAGRKPAADNGPGVFRILNSAVSFILTLVLVVVILLMVPVVLIATGILGIRPTEQNFVDRPGDGALVEDAKLVGRPVADIVATTAPQSLGVDYQVHVDCTIINRGASGLMTVSAELTKGGFWQREQMVFIPADETQQVTFAFSEPTFFWGGLNSGSAVCRAKASDRSALESQSQY